MLRPSYSMRCMNAGAEELKAGGWPQPSSRVGGLRMAAGGGRLLADWPEGLGFAVFNKN